MFQRSLQIDNQSKRESDLLMKFSDTCDPYSEHLHRMSCFVLLAMIFPLIAFIDFSPSLVIGVLELINPNLHLPRDFLNFLFINDTRKDAKTSLQTPLLYLSFSAFYCCVVEKEN